MGKNFNGLTCKYFTRTSNYIITLQQYLGCGITEIALVETKQLNQKELISYNGLLQEWNCLLLFPDYSICLSVCLILPHIKR